MREVTDLRSDNIDASRVSQFLKQLLAVFPGQAKSTHSGNAQTRNYGLFGFVAEPSLTVGLMPDLGAEMAAMGVVRIVNARKHATRALSCRSRPHHLVPSGEFATADSACKARLPRHNTKAASKQAAGQMRSE